MTTVFQGGLASIIKENPSLTWPVRDGFLFLFVKPTHLVGGCLSIPILAHTSIFYKKILAIFYAVFCFMAKTYISIHLFIIVLILTTNNILPPFFILKIAFNTQPHDHKYLLLQNEVNTLSKVAR